MIHHEAGLAVPKIYECRRMIITAGEDNIRRPRDRATTANVVFMVFCGQYLREKEDVLFTRYSESGVRSP